MSAIPITPKIRELVALKQEVIRIMQTIEYILQLEMQDLRGIQDDIDALKAGKHPERIAQLNAVK